MVSSSRRPKPWRDVDLETGVAAGAHRPPRPSRSSSRRRAHAIDGEALRQTRWSSESLAPKGKAMRSHLSDTICRSGPRLLLRFGDCDNPHLFGVVVACCRFSFRISQEARPGAVAQWSEQGTHNPSGNWKRRSRSGPNRTFPQMSVGVAGSNRKQPEPGATERTRAKTRAGLGARGRGSGHPVAWGLDTTNRRARPPQWKLSSSAAEAR
jgi:hypothetical protein